jgi:hypothetical protein
MSRSIYRASPFVEPVEGIDRVVFEAVFIRKAEDYAKTEVEILKENEDITDDMEAKELDMIEYDCYYFFLQKKFGDDWDKAKVEYPHIFARHEELEYYIMPRYGGNW